MTTNNKADATKSDASPESTWGASEETKEAWDRKYGKAARKAAEDADKEATK